MRELPFVMGCAVAMIMLLLPAAWHIRSRNSGTIIYIGWSLVGNLIYFVNSIVWAGNLRNPAPVWCDISTKIIVGLTVGLPCASLCIQRRLYLVSRVSSTSSTPEQRRREVMIDIGIGLGVPCLVMTLHYVVQGHRFNILEDYGCWPATYITGLTIPLVFMWPILISLISIPYCIGSYIQFHRRRAEFQKFLASNEPGLNVDRYLRLMALASMEIIIVLPLNLLSIIGNLTNKPLQPWVSWAYVHYNFSRVSYVPRWLLDANKKQAVQFTISRWAIPCSGILFFLFFGLSVEARKDYYRVANLVLGVFGVKLTPPSSPRASRSLVDRIFCRNSKSTIADPFENDASLTALPNYKRPRRRPDSLSIFDKLDGTESAMFGTTDRTSSIQVPEPTYQSPTKPSRYSVSSPIEISDGDMTCKTSKSTSSTAFLLQMEGRSSSSALDHSPMSPTSPASACSTSSSQWDYKPLPPVPPSSRPASEITIRPTRERARASVETTVEEMLRAPPVMCADHHHSSRHQPLLTPIDDEFAVIRAPAHLSTPPSPQQQQQQQKEEGGDDNASVVASVYHTPAATNRLSLASAATEYQPSIPDIPGSWYTSTGVGAKRSKRRPFQI